MNPSRSVIGLTVCLLLTACGASTGIDAPASASVGASPSPPAPVVSSPSPPGPVASSPSAIVLREAPADLGCDSIGWEGEPIRTLTFHVDPAAAEPVWAESDTGATLMTFWSSGFQAGTPAERLVRAPSGDVFVSDGEVVQVPQGVNLCIHDHFVCLRPDKLYVLGTQRG